MNHPSTLLARLLLGGRRLPTTQGSMRVRGLIDAVAIRRDRYGVAYVHAHNEADAWFGLGFCQAQDRAFQLELRQRVVRGTLSQVFGEQTLAIDRLARRIGFRESGRQQLAVLDDEMRTQIGAFVRGINAGLRAGAPRVAPEFALLRCRPSEWSPEDVLGIGKLLSFMLIGNWDVELTRLKILLTDGPEALRNLDPTPYPEDHVLISPSSARAGPALDAVTGDLQHFLSFAGFGGGSNAWAVAGQRTRSGKPILANDPHLEAAMPPHWYLAHLRTPEWAVAGASMIGSPGIGVGHNGFLAWGITAGLVDTVDLFIEEVGPDGRSVRRGEAYEPCSVRREVIEVRGRSPVTEEVLVTPRGPIITPALEGDLPALSMRAVWLDPKPARGFLRVHTARSFDEFRAQFKQWPLLNQNVIYADETGKVGWQLVGEAPRRRSGFGTLPLPASDLEAGWLEESVPFDQMPFAVDPPEGFVASANNKPLADHPSGPYFGVDWLDGYRAGRINEALRERVDWDVASTMRLQMDEVSLPWREVRDIILSVLEEDGGTRAVRGAGPRAEDVDGVGPLQLTARESLFLRGTLSAWDGQMSAGSTAATLFELFLFEMARRIARARAPRSAAWALGLGFTDLLPGSTFSAGRLSRVLRRLREPPDGWFPGGWPAEMRDAYQAVLRDLRTRFGPDPAGWNWGRVRPLTLEHPLGRAKPLASLFNRGPFPAGGDSNTVAQASGSSPYVIASLRGVIPVGDWDEARFVLPGGQSGNPFSPHYDDQLSLWRHGDGIAIAWSPAAVRRAAVHTLNLNPLP